MKMTLNIEYQTADKGSQQFGAHGHALVSDQSGVHNFKGLLPPPPSTSQDKQSLELFVLKKNKTNPCECDLGGSTRKTQNENHT